MKYLFYIIGCLLIFAPLEYAVMAVFSIAIGIAFHLFDINKQIDTKFSELEKRIQSDHAYLKRDINDLVNPN